MKLQFNTHMQKLKLDCEKMSHHLELLLSPLIRVAKLLMNEIEAILIFLIIKWPESPLGFRMRRMYWRRKTGVKNLAVGRGTNFTDCNLIVFGDNIDVSNDVEFIVDGCKAFIGSNILIARGVYLRSANHRFDDPNKLIMEQGHTSKKLNYNGAEYGIVIESDTWIGANAIILSGAMIGRGSVIGAGSIVTGIIPPYSIAAGCPARVISKRNKQESEI